MESMPLIAEDSDSSDNLEELKQEEYEKEMDLTEITDQLLKKFNDIRETTFSVISEKSNIEEQQRVANREILKKNKSTEERQKIISIFNSQLEEKFKDLSTLTATIDKIKGNQDNSMRKISEIEQKIFKFKESIKHRMNEKIEKSIRALESTVSKLIVNIDSQRSNNNIRSRDRQRNADDVMYQKSSTSPLRI